MRRGSYARLHDRQQARHAANRRPLPSVPVSQSTRMTPLRYLIPDDLPAITPEHPERYQVYRAVYPKGDVGAWRWEVIAEVKTELAAQLICGAQKYKSVISHRSIRGDWRPTGQPMKEVDA